MANTWAPSALWIGLASIATLLAIWIWFRMSTALLENVIGTVALPGDDGFPDMQQQWIEPIASEDLLIKKGQFNV
jgi:hypothetical protein